MWRLALTIGLVGVGILALSSKPTCVPERAIVGAEKGAVDLDARIDAAVRAALLDNSVNVRAGGNVEIESEVAKILARQGLWREWAATIKAGFWVVLYLVLHRVGLFRDLFDRVKGKPCSARHSGGKA